jgi:hypothetical protein
MIEKLAENRLRRRKDSSLATMLPCLMSLLITALRSLSRNSEKRTILWKSARFFGI